jgi:hypothetical protein
MEFCADQMVARPGHVLLLAIVAAVLRPGLGVALDSPAPFRLGSRLSDPVHAQPLAFERNEGQYARGVQFVSRTPGYTVFLEPRQVTMVFRQPSAAMPFVRMRLLQSNASSAPVSEEPQPAKTNYFIGNDPTRWRTNVPLFGKVRFPSVYKDVDLVYYGNRSNWNTTS